MKDSFGDAARGLFFAVKTERNMRIHLTAAAFVLFFAPHLGVTRGEYSVLILISALVVAAEAFNTSLEMLCDFAQKSYNPFIGRTKDIAAGAVLICAVFAAFVGAVILWRPAKLLALFGAICTTPLYLALALLALVLAVLFVFLGPVRAAESLRRLFHKK